MQKLQSRIETPYLLQRCSVQEAFQPDLKVSQYLKLDYMGSSEFEWGAIPKSMREMEKSLDSWMVSSVTHKGVTLYFTCLPHHVAPYEESVKALIEERVHLKEGMRLNAKEITWKGKGRNKKAVYDAPDAAYQYSLWMDIGNNVVIAREVEIVENFMLAVKNSVKFMNEQAALVNK